MRKNPCDNCGRVVSVSQEETLFAKAKTWDEVMTPYGLRARLHVCPSREALRDEGMARVEEAQNRDNAAWRKAAIEAVVLLAKQGRDFNADDVYLFAGRPSRPNAIGGVFRWAKTQKPPLVVAVGERKAERGVAHARAAKVYRGAWAKEKP